MIKELIKQRFSKSLETYKSNAIVQKQMAEKLVGLIENVSFDNILELGCGTGFVTELISSKYNYKQYDAIDIVDECQKHIENITNNINFISCDIENFEYQKKYDLIISNASFQWLDNPVDFIKSIKSHLNPNGIFAFTLFGKNNFKELNTIISSTPSYYSITETKEITKEYKLEHLSEENIIMNFERPKEVLQHIKHTGVNAISQEQWTKSDLNNFEKKYDEICNGNITLTYNPIYVIVKTTNSY